MLDFLKPPVAAFQDFYILVGRALRNVFRSPHYTDDIIIQMDIIGVGSLPIVVLTGFFSGVVITMQMSRALNQYGAVGQVGQIVAITLVRELGPVLTALLVAGRNASGIASELGSMKVTEQIDAMRALGTDPIQKLVTPRMIATAVMLPMLTIVADFVGIFGGYIIAYFTLALPTFAVLDHRLPSAANTTTLCRACSNRSCLHSSFPWSAVFSDCVPPAARKAWAAPLRKPWSSPRCGCSS